VLELDDHIDRAIQVERHPVSKITCIDCQTYTLCSLKLLRNGSTGLIHNAP
jgi:hypothetical protein